MQPRLVVGILVLQAATGWGGFVPGGAVDLTGFEDEGRFAVEPDVKKLFKFF